jgi:hypothetical protein
MDKVAEGESGDVFAALNAKTKEMVIAYITDYYDAYTKYSYRWQLR